MVGELHVVAVFIDELSALPFGVLLVSLCNCEYA